MSNNRRSIEVVRDFAKKLCDRGDNLSWDEAIQLASSGGSWVDIIELRTAIVNLKELAQEIYYGVIENHISSVDIILDDITAEFPQMGDRLPTEDGESINVNTFITTLIELRNTDPIIGSMRVVIGLKDITAATIVHLDDDTVLSIY